MEMTAHKGHKESKEPQAHKGQPEMTVRMETTVPLVPKGHKESKGHKVYKAHKGQQGQQDLVLALLPAH
jgi:hypothetical protein